MCGTMGFIRMSFEGIKSIDYDETCFIALHLFYIYASAGTRAQNITIIFDSVELKKAIEETQVADQSSFSI